MFKSINNSIDKFKKEDIYILASILVVGILIGMVFNSLLILSDILLIGVLYTAARLFALPDSFTERLINSYANVRDPQKETDVVEAFVSFVEAVCVIFLSIICTTFVFGKFAIDLMTINFPVLLDIKWETDWFNISFPYLMRTVINILQFIVMYCLSRKIKRSFVDYFNREEQIIDEYCEYSGSIV